MATNPLTGILSCSLGPWGERQRIFQKRAGGPFYCSVYLTDGRRHFRSLGTEDHTEALRLVMDQLSTANGVGGFNDHERVSRAAGPTVGTVSP